MKSNNLTSKLLNHLKAQSPNGPITQRPNNLPVVFLGSSKFVLPILDVLRKNFDLKLVLTTENPAFTKVSADKPKSNLASQGESLRSYPVVKYCAKNSIPYLSVQQPARHRLSPQAIAGGFNNSTIQQLRTTKSPVAILADFGLIIPTEVLNLFPKGIINIHPSLLPKYRGPTPVQTAILNGEKITGISIIKLDDRVDHGPLLGQEKEEILDADTADSLYKRLFAKGANLLLKVLNNYLKGNLKSTAQNHKEATFTVHLTRQNGYVEISKFEIRNSKLELERKIRAYFPWPGVWFKIKINGKEKIIKLLPNNLKTQYPNDLILIQVEGKKPMSHKDFLNGYPQVKQQLGKLLEQLV